MQHYYEPNDAYFRKHLQKLVKAHGGKWVVIAGGSLIGVSHEAELKKLMALARKRYPKDIPLVAPIPRKEELECILYRKPGTTSDLKNSFQAGQKGFRCKARDGRRAEAYSRYTLERVGQAQRSR